MLLKRDSNTDVFMWILQNNYSYIEEHLRTVASYFTLGGIPFHEPWFYGHMQLMLFILVFSMYAIISISIAKFIFLKTK